MKIDVNGPAASQLPLDLGTKQASKAPLASSQTVTEDWTTLHSDSLSVHALTTQALNSPDVRQGRVDALSQSIAGGNYQVDPTHIAAAMLNGWTS